jgi:glycosyltransferase involved in cell wall biosynthesis
MKTFKKRRLCLILQAPVLGGNERFMINLINGLDRDLFELHLVLFNPDGELRGLLPQDISIHSLDMKIPALNHPTNPWFIFKLACLFRKLDPDVIFSTSGYPNLFTICAYKLSFIKAYLVIREITLRFKFMKGDPLLGPKKKVYGILYHWADLIVAPSSDVLDDLRREGVLTTQRAMVIPNFVNEDLIKDGLKADLPVPRLKFDRPVIVSVTRLETEKGIDTAIEAFSRVIREVPCYYWIIGTGLEAGRLKALARSLGVEHDVIFLDFQKNPWSFLKHADIFLLPSKLEGFSNALLEAMYCGVAPVVTRYDNYIGTFLGEGKHGVLVKPDDIPDMAQGLLKLLKSPDLRRTFAASARNEVLLNNIAGSVLPKYRDIFLSKTS